MGQTLSVVVGSPVGTPGAGSITIYGSPQSKSMNGCPNTYPYDCWVTIPKGGEVLITVAGQTYAQGYSGATTGAQLASAFAGLMNYPLSPIYATVSGSTINIRSTINGAASNYPMSTSYQYDTSNFPSPAFTAGTSGALLVGGTD